MKFGNFEKTDFPKETMFVVKNQTFMPKYIVFFAKNLGFGKEIFRCPRKIKESPACSSGNTFLFAKTLAVPMEISGF